MEHERLLTAIKRVAWGYILLHFDINIGALDILPNWAGYVLLVKSIDDIAKIILSAKLLHPFGIALSVWEGFSWLIKLFGGAVDLTIPALIITVIGLYFHFQLLTNIAELSEMYDCPQTGRILTLRTVRTVTSTIFLLPFPWLEYEFAVWVILIVQITVAIWICSVMFSLRRALEGCGAPPTADDRLE